VACPSLTDRDFVILMDEFILSRIQFAANITFHILFPTITIALGWLLLYFKLRYMRSGEFHWMELYFIFTKVFALAFSMGVVSGVTMSFQFGTNWPGYMNTVGNIAGPLLAYEVITAFFLEATFLGIMLFAFRKVPAWMHTGATFLVAVGTSLSAFWILALNSWMHTPQGFEWIDGVIHATSWREIIFSPSMPYRLTHTLLSSGLTAAFLVGGLMAYRKLKGDRRPAVESGLRTASTLILVLAPLQAVVGDLHGTNTRDYQPAKLAAMEGLWETQRGAPLVLFALPDATNNANRFEIGIPKLGSLIATRDIDGSYALIYIPTWSQAVQIDLHRLDGERFQASWFNPRNGETTALGEVGRQDNPTFTATERGPDWVLVLDRIGT